MWPNIEADVLGDVATVTADSGVYSDTTVFKTAYWMTDQFYVFLQKDSSSNWIIELRNKKESETDLQHAAADFCNKLIDFRLREIVNAETLGVREALVKRAFMEGIPKPGLGGAVSNEGHLNPGFKNDRI